MHRSKMSKEERGKRSRLTQMVHSREFVRGTLTMREKTCGRSNCQCTEGQKHLALYLVHSEDGKVEQLYVPKKWQERVQQWVKQYKDIRGLLEDISDTYWQKLRKREE